MRRVASWAPTETMSASGLAGPLKLTAAHRDLGLEEEERLYFGCTSCGPLHPIDSAKKGLLAHANPL